MDEKETLFWTMVRNFEELALERYEQTVHELASPEKRQFVQDLHDLAPDNELLNRSELNSSVQELLSLAKGNDRKQTLILQGLILERLGEAIYEAVAHSPHLSLATQALAARGQAISASILASAPRLISQELETGEPLFMEFVTTSKGVLSHLDALGEGIDHIFSDRFEMKFSDVMGKFGSDLIQSCLGLGFNRRKLICHMTGAWMGL